MSGLKTASESGFQKFWVTWWDGKDNLNEPELNKVQRAHRLQNEHLVNEQFENLRSPLQNRHNLQRFRLVDVLQI